MRPPPRKGNEQGGKAGKRRQSGDTLLHGRQQRLGGVRTLQRGPAQRGSPEVIPEPLHAGLGSVRALAAAVMQAHSGAWDDGVSLSAWCEPCLAATLISYGCPPCTLAALCGRYGLICVTCPRWLHREQ